MSWKKYRTKECRANIRLYVFARLYRKHLLVYSPNMHSMRVEQATKDIISAERNKKRMNWERGREWKKLQFYFAIFAFHSSITSFWKNFLSFSWCQFGVILEGSSWHQITKKMVCFALFVLMRQRNFLVAIFRTHRRKLIERIIERLSRQYFSNLRKFPNKLAMPYCSKAWQSNKNWWSSTAFHLLKQRRSIPHHSLNTHLCAVAFDDDFSDVCSFGAAPN